MAQGVVYFLEMIQIQKQECAGGGPVGAAPQGVDPGAQPLAVVQPGEGVLVGALGKLFLAAALFGDILEGDDGMGGAAVLIEHGGEDHPVPDIVGTAHGPRSRSACTVGMPLLI